MHDFFPRFSEVLLFHRHWTAIIVIGNEQFSGNNGRQGKQTEHLLARCGFGYCVSTHPLQPCIQKKM